MTTSDIANYTNPVPQLNCLRYAAAGLADRLGRWGWHNLKLRFKPLQVLGYGIRPLDPDCDPDAIAPAAMEPEGALFMTPLNYYIKVKYRGENIYLNAGYLWQHFMCGEANGYREVLRMLRQGE